MYVEIFVFVVKDFKNGIGFRVYFICIYTYFLEFLKSEVFNLSYDLRKVIFGYFLDMSWDSK